MRVGLLTREYPPAIYGGAGVHVDYLSRQLRDLVDLTVLCMGEDRPDALAFSETDPRFPSANPALQTMSTDLAMVAACEGLDLVHSHTWYANFAGHIAKLLYGVPHVISRAFPRAVASVEGRAARRWLPGVVVGRANRLPGGRRGDRGEPRHGRRRPRCLPGARPGSGSP